MIYCSSFIEELVASRRDHLSKSFQQTIEHQANVAHQSRNQDYVEQGTGIVAWVHQRVVGEWELWRALLFGDGVEFPDHFQNIFSRFVAQIPEIALTSDLLMRNSVDASFIDVLDVVKVFFLL